MSGLSDEDRELLLCDCDVALADDACPVHSEDGMSLWTEKPAAVIAAAVEQIIARHVQAAITAERNRLADEIGLLLDETARRKPEPCEDAIEGHCHRDGAFAAYSRSQCIVRPHTT